MEIRLTPSMVLNMLAANSDSLSTRRALSRKMFDQHVDIDYECGYVDPSDLKADDYWELFKREPIARRVVRCHPNASWGELPCIYETEDPDETAWEKTFKAIEKKTSLISKWHRLDVLCGIGRYGVLFLGFDDGKPPSEPAGTVTVSARGETKVTGKLSLLYARPYSERSVRILTKEIDPANDRFGLPTMYEIRVEDNDSPDVPVAADQGQGKDANTGRGMQIHWTRVIHVADNVLDNDLAGDPRMQGVWTRLNDLRKLYGGSAEMFWRGAFPGYSFEVNPDVADPELDTESVRKEFEDYSRTMQRYMATQGVNVKLLAPTVADPKSHIDSQLQAIAIELEVPLRILMGTEEGQLAGDQDSDSWRGRVRARRNNWVVPNIIRPTIDRLTDLGALPALPEEGDYTAEWEEPEQQPLEKAQVAAAVTDALSKYVQGNVDAILPVEDYFTQILGWDADQVAAIEDSQLQQIRDEERAAAELANTPPPPPVIAGPGGAGGPPKAAPKPKQPPAA